MQVLGTIGAVAVHRVNEAACSWCARLFGVLVLRLDLAVVAGTLSLFEPQPLKQTFCAFVLEAASSAR